jgi:uncharacterized coiled-coil protein SlyX
VANLLGELRASNRRLDQTIAKFPVDKLSGELTGLVTELRDSNQRLAKVLADPAMTRLPEQTAAMVSTTTGAFERMRNFLDNPELGRSVAQLQRTVGRLERILVGREGDIATTLENLRLISDNLRDTTESAKHYPSQLLLGEPPPRARSAP